MMRTCKPAVAVAALLAFAAAGRAQPGVNVQFRNQLTGKVVSVGAGRNPLTGGVSYAGTNYNPLNGKYREFGATANPFTGQVQTGRTTYNPVTGTYSRSGTYYNPMTGQAASGQVVYNPYTGGYAPGVNTVNPYTGMVQGPVGYPNPLTNVPQPPPDIYNPLNGQYYGGPAGGPWPGGVYERAAQVRDLYLRFLRREPNSGEVQHWVGSAAPNLTWEMMNSLLSSDEYYRIYGRSPERWIAGLYADVLNRQAAPPEANGWWRDYNAHGDRGRLVADFLTAAGAEQFQRAGPLIP
jgi:hypothetical protein